MKTTPLIEASKHDHIEAAQLLLENGADVHACDDEAYYYADTADMMQLLIDYGANIYARDWYDDLRDNGGKEYSQFHDLCEAGATDKVRVLINAGIDINRQNNDGCFTYSTPLDRATSGDYIDTMRLLIESGVNKESITGALYHICSVEAAKLLIDNGADIHTCGRHKGVPLDSRNNSDIGDLLLYYDNIIRDKVDKGEGTIHEAAYYGNINMIKRHLDAGISINAQNDKCETPLLLAVMRGHYKTVRHLLDHGADRSIVSINGDIPYDVLHDNIKWDKTSKEYRELYDDLYVKCKHRKWLHIN